MGTYINKGNDGFLSAINSQYVDKTGMIAVINKTLDTERRYTCVTRCRRFGKSMAAKMLCAYYDKSCDSRSLFEGLAISLPDKMGEDKQYEKHLNKYPVISIDMTKFTTRYRKDDMIVKHIQEDVKRDILETYPEVKTRDDDDLMEALLRVAMQTGEKFIIIIDEWDAILREMEEQPDLVNEYVDLLRRMFKGDDSTKVFAGVYMTGILPIKKYKTQSALNNFREYSIIDPGNLATFFGFTQKEVNELASTYGVDVEQLKQWYDGYRIGDEPSIYNPYSVMEAVVRHRCRNYWQKTGAYNNVLSFIQMNFNGLKDDILKMLAGGRCRVNTTKFQNDISVITCKDDVLTVLIHLGYLGYDWDADECYIPNKEVSEEFTNAVEDTSWRNVAETLENSRDLVEATLNGNGNAVEKAIDRAHDENTSILSYNDENSLACVLSIAYIYARNDYVIHRELATGKGYADLVMLPRKNVSKPALVVELKCDQSADAAIDQIRRKEYPEKVAEYTGDILLVGINYDRESKQHTCRIELYDKGM